MHDKQIVLKNILFHCIVAVFGGFVYMGVELLWRGHTHWTMGVLGGICFVLIGLLDEVQEHPPILKQMFQGAVIVTALEFVFGLILNVWLKLGIWDYSNLPFNIMGQICLQFFVAWFFLSYLAIKLENLTHKLKINVRWITHGN